jgi:hypothetical protein
MGADGLLAASRPGRISDESNSQAAGSRKKAVTLIRRVSKRAVNSPGSTWRKSR